MDEKNFRIKLIILVALLLVSLVSVFALGNPLATNKKDLHDPNSFLKEPEPELEELKFETLELGTYCSIGKRQGKILEDEEQLKSLWKDAFSTREPLFTLDFEEKRVVAIFLGDKPTGGYVVEIEKILANEKKIDVNVNAISPGKGCMVPMVMTQPYHIVSFDDNDIKGKRPVNFQVTNVIAENCN